MFFKNLISNLLWLVPQATRYKVCRHHVDKELAENRSEFATNGEARLLRQVIPNCQVVFDVGANVGEWSLFVHSLQPKMDLHCFEPCASTFRALTAATADINAQCNDCALGDEPGEQKMYVFGPENKGNGMYSRDGLIGVPAHKLETIQVDTLDHYCAENNIAEIDFLKIDVEGYEHKVLLGGEQTFTQQKVKYCQFEYGATYRDARILLQDMFIFFARHGYRVYLLYPDHVRAFDTYDDRLENFQYKNFVATRKDMPPPM